MVEDKLMSIRVRASRIIFITLMAAGRVLTWRWISSPTGKGINQKLENKTDVRSKSLSRSGPSSVSSGVNGAVVLPVEVVPRENYLIHQATTQS